MAGSPVKNDGSTVKTRQPSISSDFLMKKIARHLILTYIQNINLRPYPKPRFKAWYSDLGACHFDAKDTVDEGAEVAQPSWIARIHQIILLGFFRTRQYIIALFWPVIPELPNGEAYQLSEGSITPPHLPPIVGQSARVLCDTRTASSESCTQRPAGAVHQLI